MFVMAEIKASAAAAAKAKANSRSPSGMTTKEGVPWTGGSSLDRRVLLGGGFAGAFLEGFDELLPVLLGLVGVGEGEAGDGLAEALGGAEVAGQHDEVAGAGVAAGEDLAGDLGVLHQAGRLEGGEVERGLVVVELADEEAARLAGAWVGDGGPAEEGIGLDLHGALAFDDAAALMGVRESGFVEVGGVGGGGLLLDLEEERVLAAVALEVKAVVAEADGAGADHLEGDIEDAV